MNNYDQKDGMNMIFRAILITGISLIICWYMYKIIKPTKKVQEYKLENTEKDLGDIVFEYGPNGEFLRAH